jgi:hypothetical protein
MLDWLTGKRNRKQLPEYSALRATPTRGLPPDLAGAEESESFGISHENIEHELRKLPRRPVANEPLFMELLEANGSGVVTIILPDQSGQCLPVFSTALRAFDYVQMLLASGPAVRYLSSTPLELVQMLHDIEAIGIKTLALDRCPRCSIFTTTGTRALRLQMTSSAYGLSSRRRNSREGTSISRMPWSRLVLGGSKSPAMWL